MYGRTTVISLWDGKILMVNAIISKKSENILVSKLLMENSITLQIVHVCSMMNLLKKMVKPLIMTITTASSGEDPANPEMQLYTMAKKIEAGEVNDPSFYYRIYEADKDCNVEDEAQWYKSNPALGVFRKLEDLANYAKRIRLMPLQENMFRRMFLNQHVALDHEKGAINMDLWDTCTKKVDTEDLKGWKCWGGLDLSSKNDITGFVLVFYEETTGRFIVVPYLYTPKETVAYRQHKDNNPYEYWIKKGDLIALDGKYINFDRFLDHATELDETYRIEQIGFDQWGSQTIINRLEDRWEVIPLGQGTKTMTQVINDFENLLVDERIIIAENECFRFMAKNCIAVYDEMLGVKYSKKKSKFKIDGIIAMLMGLLLCIEENGIEHYNPVEYLDAM